MAMSISLENGVFVFRTTTPGLKSFSIDMRAHAPAVWDTLPQIYIDAIANGISQSVRDTAAGVKTGWADKWTAMMKRAAQIATGPWSSRGGAVDTTALRSELLRERDRAAAFANALAARGEMMREDGTIVPIPQVES